MSATIIGAAISVSGRVDGKILCTGRVALTPSACVSGEITARTLIMEEGAVFEGQLKMASSGREAAPTPGPH